MASSIIKPAAFPFWEAEQVLSSPSTPGGKMRPLATNAEPVEAAVRTAEGILSAILNSNPLCGEAWEGLGKRACWGWRAGIGVGWEYYLK
jgi:hypothetical protein